MNKEIRDAIKAGTALDAGWRRSTGTWPCRESCPSLRDRIAHLAYFAQAPAEQWRSRYGFEVRSDRSTFRTASKSQASGSSWTTLHAEIGTGRGGRSPGR